MSDLNSLREQWPAVSTRLDEALALAEVERSAWLAALPESDSIKAELRRLLAETARIETADFPSALPKLSLVSQGASGTDPNVDVAPGSTIGPYRLLAPLGHGGMGAVWLAERSDGQPRRKIALKLPHLGWVPGLAERLARERDILASLEHPNIARLYDAGVDQLGRPYLALEYVDGTPIDRYCNERGLALRQRLGLILQVAAAVAHAHTRLVVHRDLKPSNILVAASGEVRLLDFGIAKVLAQVGPDASELTHRAGRALTPDYASPEQIRGEPIGTVSDVYSLGVVAYAVVTGVKPYSLAEHGVAGALAQAIARVEPLPASRAAADPLLRRQLAGDLDAIFNKVLKKDVAERYPSVEAFMRDIERHLANLPVLARPDTLPYRLRKFGRRYRWPLGAGALVFAALSTGLAATAWQARRAELERDVARRAATREEAVRYHLTTMFRASIAQKSDGTPVTAKAMLDRSAQRLLKEYSDDPRLAGKIVVTLADLYAALEDTEGMGRLLEGFLAAVGAEADAESVALARQKLAQVELTRGHVARAAELLAPAEAHWARAPEHFHEQHLEALFVRALLQRNQGDLAGAIATYQRAIAERSAFSGAVHRETANLYNSLAITLTSANRVDEALEAYRTTLAIHDKLGQGEDLDALVIRGNTGTLALRVGRLGEAEQILKAAYEKQRERAGDSAAVAASMGLYGASLVARARAAEAIAILEPALAMAVQFAGAQSPLAIQDRLFLTDALTAAGELTRARAIAAQNHQLASERFGDKALLTLRVRIGQARIRLEAGDAAAAQADYAALTEPLRALGRPAQAALAHALLGNGEALLAADQPAAAAVPLREALRLRQDLLWEHSWELALARVRLGEALKRSQGSGGVEFLEQGTATLAAQLGEGHPQVQRARRVLALPS